MESAPTIIPIIFEKLITRIIPASYYLIKHVWYSERDDNTF